MQKYVIVYAACNDRAHQFAEYVKNVIYIYFFFGKNND